MTPVPGPDSQKRVFCRHQRQDNNKSRYFSCPGIFFLKPWLSWDVHMHPLSQTVGTGNLWTIPRCHWFIPLLSFSSFFYFLIWFYFYTFTSVSRLDLPLCQTWLLFCQTCQIKGTMKLQQILNADEMACVQIGEVIRKGPQIPNHGWSRPWRDSIINIKWFKKKITQETREANSVDLTLGGVSRMVVCIVTLLVSLPLDRHSVF